MTRRALIISGKPVTSLRCLAAILVFFLAVAAAVPSFAQSSAATAAKIQPVEANLLADDTPFTLHDAPALVRLPADAASVVIGNPVHAQAVVENPRLILLMPRQPGATHLTVLDSSGGLILSRKVLVGGGEPRTGQLRINRVCRPDDTRCQPVTLYSCAGRCYQSNLPDASDTSLIAAPTNAISSAAQEPSVGEQALPIVDEGTLDAATEQVNDAIVPLAPIAPAGEDN